MESGTPLPSDNFKPTISANLTDLQERVLRDQLKPVDLLYLDKLYDESLDTDPETLFATLGRAVRIGIVAPNDLLVVSMEYALSYPREIAKCVCIRLFGIALRNGADPNHYVLTEMGLYYHFFYYTYQYLGESMAIVTGLRNRDERCDETLCNTLKTETRRNRLDKTVVTSLYESTRRLLFSTLTLYGVDPELPAFRTTESDVAHRDAFFDSVLGATSENTVLYFLTLENEIDLVDRIRLYSQYRNRPQDLLSEIARDSLRSDLDADLESDLLDNSDTIVRTELELIVQIALITDNPKSIRTYLANFGDSVYGNLLDRVVSCYSTEIWTEFLSLVPYTEYSEWAERAVAHLNTVALRSLVVRGFGIDYTFIESLVQHCTKIYVDSPLIVSIINRMLIVLVENGIDIDELQLGEIALYSPSTVASIRDIYKTPFWSRTCKIGGSAETRLRDVARSLNIDPSLTKPDLCDRIDRIARSPTPLESVQSRLGAPVCKNPSLLERESSEYTTLDLSSYTEFSPTDPNGITWCFTSDHYSGLLRTRKNPYTGQPLPLTFIEEIRGKLAVLGAVDALETRVSVSEAVAQLFVGDGSIVTRRDEFLQTFIEFAQENGIDASVFIDSGNVSRSHRSIASETVLSINELASLLSRIVANPVPLSQFSRDSAIASFCAQIFEAVEKLSVRDQPLALSEIASEIKRFLS